MVMPACGTFHYSGVVPDAKAALESGHWTLEDRSGAALRAPTSELRDNRLVGLEPTLRISESDLVLETASRQRAQIRSASLEIDRSLIERLQGGDVLTLIRTGTADIGISVLRRGQLMVAVGAVTVTPLGDEVRVRSGPVVDHPTVGSQQWPRTDTWIEVSASAETRRLRGGEATTIGSYWFSVVRCFRDGIPGTYESLAISVDAFCGHEAAVRSAELLSRPNAGLMMKKWS